MSKEGIMDIKRKLSVIVSVFMKYFWDLEKPEEKEGTCRSSCIRIGTFLVVRKILGDYGLPAMAGSIMAKKRDNLIILLYAVFIFGIMYIFYINVEPIMICDPDDWTYISSIRSPYPIWKNWNPSKVFSENLMGICGFFSAYVVYPVLKDYILSFTYVYAFVISIFITFYMTALLLLIRKVLNMKIQESLICSFVAYLLHFLFYAESRHR